MKHLKVVNLLANTLLEYRDGVVGENSRGGPTTNTSGPVWRTCSSFSLPQGTYTRINIYPDWCSDRETTIMPLMTVWELEQKKGEATAAFNAPHLYIPIVA